MKLISVRYVVHSSDWDDHNARNPYRWYGEVNDPEGEDRASLVAERIRDKYPRREVSIIKTTKELV